jgi:hypothetical protein
MSQFINFIKSLNFAKIIASLSLSVLFLPAYSQETIIEAANLTITTIGVHTDTPYFRVAEPIGAQCAYAIVYIPADKKLLYAQVLSAKSSGSKLSRLAFKLNGANSECYAVVIEIA